LGSLKAYLLARLLWNPYMSEEEYQAHMDDFLEGYYGPGWHNVKEYMRLLHDATRHRHMGCFEKMDIGGELGEEYYPKAYQEVVEDSYLSDFINNHLDKAIRLWDDTIAKAEDEGQRERARRSRLAMTYLDLFCRKHDKENMSEEEQKAYEAGVEQFHEDKIRYGCHFNIWTAWQGS
jgi:hypothetical protein